MHSNKPNATTRTLAVLEALAGYAAQGARNKELAAACGLSEVDTTRSLAVLLAYGWASKSEETARYYPTDRFARLIVRVVDDFEAAEQRLKDMRRNFVGR